MEKITSSISIDKFDKQVKNVIKEMVYDGCKIGYIKSSSSSSLVFEMASPAGDVFSIDSSNDNFRELEKAQRFAKKRVKFNNFFKSANMLQVATVIISTLAIVVSLL